MPAILHTKATLNASGLALVSQSATEQKNGLMNVGLEFVCKTSNSPRLDALFQTDSPPPLWPEGVSRDALIKRQLFMESRSLRHEYGLTYITANYVGGIVRRGGYYLQSSALESPQGFTSQFSQTTITQQDPANPTSFSSFTYTPFLSYKYRPISSTFEFIQVLDEASFTPSQPPVRELYVLVSFSSIFYRRAPQQGWSALESYEWNEDQFRNIIERLPLASDRKENQVTPSVRAVTLRYYLDV
jgi:hypothetical protein